MKATASHQDVMKLIFFGFFYFGCKRLDASLNSLKPRWVQFKGDSVNEAAKNWEESWLRLTKKAPEPPLIVVIVCVSLFTLHCHVQRPSGCYYWLTSENVHASQRKVSGDISSQFSVQIQQVTSSFLHKIKMHKYIYVTDPQRVKFHWSAGAEVAAG